jgi:hypothetical protein
MMTETKHTPVATPARRIAIAPTIYLVGAITLAAGIVVQIFLVGMNVFLRPIYWADHIALGHALGGLVMIQLVVALVGRLPARIRWLNALMLLLFGLQYNARALAGLVQIPALTALHAANALFLFWIAVTLAGWARRRS